MNGHNNNKSLSWETFDFGVSPKWDQRFHQPLNEEEDDEDDASLSTVSQQEQFLSVDNSNTGIGGGIASHSHNSISNTCNPQDEEPQLDDDTFASTLSSVESPEIPSPQPALRSTSSSTNTTPLSLPLRHSRPQSTPPPTHWSQLDPALIQRGIAALTPYVRPRRIATIRRVLAHRTGHTHFLFEHPSNPSNVWACLRTLDAFGVQHVHVVLSSDTDDSSSIPRKAQKQGVRTAVGSAQWLTLRQYSTTAEAIRALQQHFRLVVADVTDDDEGVVTPSIDIRDINWSPPGNDDRPWCIVMGNEETGVTDEMRAAADIRFRLPMVGFVESFNLSVATAICLSHLSVASNNNDNGPLRPGDLSPHQYDCLLLKGLWNSVAQKRVANAILRQQGIAIPPHVMRQL